MDTELQPVDDLLERERELAALLGLGHRAAAGAGQLAIVRGPAGCGKTRLLAAARDALAARGLRVFAARAGELERDFAFGVARQLLEAPLAAAAPQQRARLLGGAAALAAPVMGADAAARSDDAVQHGLYWLVANFASQRPLLLCVDDAHWCDPPSARWLAYMARRLDGLPVLLVLGVRSGEAGLVPDRIEALMDTASATVVEPAALSVGAIGRLVSRGLGVQADAAFARSCHAATHGNPFFATELITSLAHDRVAPVAANVALVATAGPQTVARGVRRRVALLGSQAQAVVTAVAVLGTDAQLRHVAALADLDLDAAGRAADRLADVAVLAAGRPLDFAHPIVRHAVEADLSPAARAAGHRRAARMLSDEDAPVAEIAGHLLHCEAGGDAWVVEVLMRAAADALARGAPDVAVTLLARALREPPSRAQRPALLRDLGRAQLRSGDRGDAMSAAIEHLAEARATAADVRLRASTAVELAIALWGAERTVEAVDVLATEAHRLEIEDPDLALGLEAHLVATGWLESATSRLVAGRLQRYAPIAGHTRPQRLAAGAAAFEALAQGAPAAVVADLAQQALAVAPARDGDEPAPPPWPIVALTCIDRFGAAQTACDAQLAAARAGGEVRSVIILVGFRSAIGLRRGALAEAEADARDAFELAGARGFALDLPATRAFLIELLVEQGRFAEAALAVDEAGQREDVPPHIAWNWFRHARGRARLAAGDAAGALADHLACGEWMREWGGGSPAVMPWRSAAALAHLALGDTAAARPLAAEEAALARTIGAPRAVGRALRVQGLATGGAEGERLLADAIAALGAAAPGDRAELELAHALVDAGAAARRAGRRRDARAHLAAGMDLGHRCAAAPLVQRAREELHAAGARPRRPAVTGRDALTPSERRVAERAAAGLTNRQIAQELFVTPRTVEVHLTHVFSKLDIRSRSDLPAALRTTAPEWRDE